MKKIIFAIVMAAGLAGCSGLAGNKTLGKFPAIYATMDESIQYDRGNKTVMAAAEDGERELQRIDGREVPFESTYEDPNFKVRSATISAADSDAGTGALSVDVYVEATHDLQPSRNAALYYLVLNAENVCLSMGEINPFFHISVMAHSIASPMSSAIVRAGALCHPEGTSLMLYCRSYDMRDFDRILFIPEQMYRSMQ